jgi:hypothetical protein
MDVKRHASIYDELLKLNIVINFQDTPTPAYIQEKIIQCNNYQLKVERYFIEVTRDLANAERMFSTERLNITTLKTSLITNNEAIKKMPTGKEREAAADEMLESNHRELLRLENDVNDLKSILSAIRQKQSTLKSTNNDIKSLQKLMEQMVNRMGIGHPDDPDVKELAGALSEIDRLEEEFELGDVESSVEESQSDDVDTIDDTLDESVVDDTEDSISLDELVAEDTVTSGDNQQSEPISTGNHEDGGQGVIEKDELDSLLDVSGDEVSPEPIETDPPREDRQDADSMEDELASLLSDDSTSVEDTSYDEETPIENFSKGEEISIEDPSDVEEPQRSDGVFTAEDTLELEQSSSDIPADEGDSVADVDLDSMSGIDVDDDMDTNVESTVTEPPKVEVDLGDLGIDLDMGGISIPGTKKSAPSTKEEKSTKKTTSVKADTVKAESVKTDPVKTDSVKADTKKENTTVQKAPPEAKKAEVKKEDPPVQKVPVTTKKAEVIDIDLDDVLNSL